MPEIKPLDLNDCLRFIADYKKDIEAGVYLVDIREEWVALISETDLLFLLKHGTTNAKWTIAKATTSTSMLEVLAQDDDENTRYSVANNGHTPLEVLQALASDPEETVRCVVAWNPNTPPSALEILAGDPDFRVRAHVGRNRNTPATALEFLARDSAANVRSAVAANNKTAVAALEILVRDSDRDIRVAVAGNPNAPVNILEALARDRSAAEDEGLGARALCCGRPRGAVVPQASSSISADLPGRDLRSRRKGAGSFRIGLRKN